MTREQALRALETLEDVFTPEGDAVVIGHIRRNHLGPDRAIAYVSGAHVDPDTPYRLADLTAKEDL